MNAMRGIEARPLAVGLDDELRPANLELARQAPTETNSYVVRGEYGRILGGYLSFFPRDSLFLTSTAALVLAPGDVLRELWRFLGVDESHVPINLDVRYRRSADRRRVPGVDLRRLRDHVRGWRAFRAIWYRLPFDFRAHVSQAYWHLALRVDLWNRTSGDVGSPTLQPDLVERLIRHYEPDMLKLEKLVGHVTGLALGAPRSGGLTELEGAGSAAA